jgi:hypothetical protein
MKSKTLAFLVFSVVVTLGLGAQSQPGRAESDPLFFVKIAANVAGNVQHETVEGSLGMYISEQNWAAALKDSDLGPFLKVKEGKPGRSAACLFSQNKDSAVCVYFDGDSPFGLAAVKAGASGKIEAGDITAAYKPISKDVLKKGSGELTFGPTDLSMDDGQPLPAFIVTSAKPKVI